MLEEVQSIQASNLAKLKLSHGWFKKYGGASSGQFKSLNVKRGIGDSEENVQENLKRAAASLKLKADDMIFIRHNFKDNILIVDDAIKPGTYDNYDAVITNRKGVVLAQGTADCGTIIISDINSSFIALVHGSWHTTKLKIIKKVIEQVKLSYGIDPKDIIVGFGPMACGGCFEFGPEAKDLFSKKHLKLRDGKIFYDIKQDNIDQLVKSGVRSDNIWDSGICTIEDDEFFSYRKAKSRGGDTGRFLSLVAPG